MKPKTFIQTGTFSIAFLVPIFILSIYSLFNSYSSNLVLKSILSIVFLLCILTFYRLKVTVTDKEVSFKMGIGLIHKKYKIDELKACNAVKNSVVSGIGIRLLSNGWLYNVSGLKSIELQFKNRKSIVRIGTNEPEELSELVESYIS